MTKQNKNQKKTTTTTTKNSTVDLPKIKPKNSSKESSEKGFSPIFWGIVALTVVAFSPIFSHEFVNWDDDVNLQKNLLLQSFSFENVIAIFKQTVIGNYNPLPIFTFAIERALFGEENWAAAVHVNNLLLHLGCVYFVYRLAVEMAMNRPMALFLTALFALHPMRVESVAWATERKDVLYAIFYFAALLQYVKYLKSNNYRLFNRHLVWAFLLFIPALFSKVQAVCLPLSMLAFDYYFKRPLGLRLVLEKAHFWLGALAMGLVNVYSLASFKSIGGVGVGYSFFDRMCVAAYAHGVYLVKSIVPYRMSPLYPYEEKVPIEYRIAAVFFLLTVGFVVWAWRQNWRDLVFGWLFFFVNFIFVSQIVGAGQGLLADRFTYVAYFGFFFILVMLWSNLPISAQVKNIIAAAWVLGLSAWTFQQNKIWENSETLWTHVIKYYPNTNVPFGNRGNYFRDKGIYDRALADLSESIRIKPNADTYNTRGKLFFDNGKVAIALNDYNAAIKLDTSKAEYFANRAAAFGTLNRLDSAEYDLDDALRLDSMNINARVNRGTLYLAKKAYQEALNDLNFVLDKDKKHQNAYLNRSLVLKNLGQKEPALADMNAYLAINPKKWEVWFDRALLKRELALYNEALTDLAEALRINPKLAQVYVERALCYQKLNNPTEAEKQAALARQNGIPFQLPNYE